MRGGFRLKIMVLLLLLLVGLGGCNQRPSSRGTSFGGEGEAEEGEGEGAEPEGEGPVGEGSVGEGEGSEVEGVEGEGAGPEGEGEGTEGEGEGAEGEGEGTVERICQPGRMELCYCENGAAGAQRCSDDGLRWLPCVCEAEGEGEGSVEGEGEGAEGEGEAQEGEGEGQPFCEPWNDRECDCPGGGTGFQVCDPSGDFWGPCQECGICEPFEERACDCPDGGEGWQTCNGAGTAWGECTDCPIREFGPALVVTLLELDPSVGFDVNGDGLPENALANNPLGPALFNDQLRQAILAGTPITVLELANVRSWVNERQARVQVYHATPERGVFEPAADLQGEGQFYVNQDSYDPETGEPYAFSPAQVGNGSLSAPQGAFPLEFTIPLLPIPLAVIIEPAMLEASYVRQGSVVTSLSGSLGGLIRAEQLDLGGLGLEQLLGPPDADWDGDGVPESYSVGLRLEAVTCEIVGVMP